MTKIAGSGSISQTEAWIPGYADPDLYQNVMDPEHCIYPYLVILFRLICPACSTW
jgi:hypothetical protein